MCRLRHGEKHMALWTVLGCGNAGNTIGHTFAITLDTGNDRWSAGGPNVNEFLATRNGSFNISALPELGTQLLGEDRREAAFLAGLTGNTERRQTGSGRTSRGVTFNWTLDSK